MEQHGTVMDSEGCQVSSGCKPVVPDQSPSMPVMQNKDLVIDIGTCLARSLCILNGTAATASPVQYDNVFLQLGHLYAGHSCNSC